MHVLQVDPKDRKRRIVDTHTPLRGVREENGCVSVAADDGCLILTFHPDEVKAIGLAAILSDLSGRTMVIERNKVKGTP